jgi:hypothetical protein
MKETVIGSDIVFAESLNLVFAGKRPELVQVFDRRVVRQDIEKVIVLQANLLLYGSDSQGIGAPRRLLLGVNWERAQKYNRSDGAEKSSRCSYWQMDLHVSRFPFRPRRCRYDDSIVTAFRCGVGLTKGSGVSGQ